MQFLRPHRKSVEHDGMSAPRTRHAPNIITHPPSIQQPRQPPSIRTYPDPCTFQNKLCSKTKIGTRTRPRTRMRTLFPSSSSSSFSFQTHSISISISIGIISAEPFFASFYSAFQILLPSSSPPPPPPPSAFPSISAQRNKNGPSCTSCSLAFTNPVRSRIDARNERKERNGRIGIGSLFFIRNCPRLAWRIGSVRDRYLLRLEHLASRNEPFVIRHSEVYLRLPTPVIRSRSI